MDKNTGPQKDDRSNKEPENTALGRLNGPTKPKKARKKVTKEQRQEDPAPASRTVEGEKVVNTDEQRHATNRDAIRSDSVASTKKEA